MPHVVVTASAKDGIIRCREFLAIRNPAAAVRAGEMINNRMALLKTTPEMGKPHPLFPLLRELTIPFGDSGYIALYIHEPADDAVYVLAFRHLKEVGY